MTAAPFIVPLVLPRRHPRVDGSCPRAVRLDAWVRDALRAGHDRAGASGSLRLADHRECVLLSGLCRGALCEQLARGPGRRLAAGRLVYREGEDAHSVYLLRSGLVKTSVLSEAGEELTLRVHRPGEIFGELCLCAGERRDRATALQPTEVVHIPLSALLAQLRRDPQAALEFTRSLCERLDEAYDQLRSLSTDPVLRRLVRTLLKLADDPGGGALRATEIAHHITQEELARMVGARREVVSGLLNRLRERGLISYARRGPIHVDRSALEAFLGPTGPE